MAKEMRILGDGDVWRKSLQPALPKESLDVHLPGCKGKRLLRRAMVIAPIEDEDGSADSNNLIEV